MGNKRRFSHVIHAGEARVLLQSLFDLHVNQLCSSLPKAKPTRRIQSDVQVESSYFDLEEASEEEIESDDDDEEYTDSRVSRKRPSNNSERDEKKKRKVLGDVDMNASIQSSSLKQMTVKQLQELLRAKGLAVSGKKDELIRRLEESANNADSDPKETVIQDGAPDPVREDNRKMVVEWPLLPVPYTRRLYTPRVNLPEYDV